ncbi:hypothetical protein AAGG74_14920 [Bacillus mexicanus]|uniref:hypothetical protein n=1 Tax=Bacillus mexicanus TaxID=2834415 RepID=UPI003D22FB3A
MHLNMIPGDLVICEWENNKPYERLLKMQMSLENMGYRLESKKEDSLNIYFAYTNEIKGDRKKITFCKM